MAYPAYDTYNHNQVAFPRQYSTYNGGDYGYHDPLTVGAYGEVRHPSSASTTC